MPKMHLELEQPNGLYNIDLKLNPHSHGQYTLTIRPTRLGKNVGLTNTYYSWTGTIDEICLALINDKVNASKND